MKVEVLASTAPGAAAVTHEVLSRSIARWGGAPAPGVAAGRFSARATGEFVPDRSGTWEFGLASAGEARLFLDDQLLAVSTEPDVHYRAGMTEVTAAVELECGSSHPVGA